MSFQKIEALKRNSAYLVGLQKLPLLLHLLAIFGDWIHEKGLRRLEIMMPDWSDNNEIVTTWRIVLFNFWILRGFVEYNPRDVPINLTAPHNHSQNMLTFILSGRFTDRQWTNIPYDPLIRQPPVFGEPDKIVIRRAGQARIMPYAVVHCPQAEAGTTVLSIGYGRKRGITDLRD